MADLMGGRGPVTSNGQAPTSGRRPTAAPVPTGSPSGIRSPRMIMQEREARVARQKAEAEQLQLERNRAEQEARLLEEARQRQSAERRAAGVAATLQGSGANAQLPPQQRQQSIDPRHQGQEQPQQSRVPMTQAPPQQRPARVANTQPPPAPQGYTAAPATSQQPPQQPNLDTQGGDAAAQAAANAKPRNSFPHAFERWETLSAHWEGLTSYWIRKLEQNKDDINRDPINQQLGRQVTDLSAAGANLFHAVVELQRLRASSERKFQRWFFETRAELERAQEVNAVLSASLEKERQGRADAIRDAVDHERGTSKAQSQLQEMRKELAISKEEARRAWEELGRREQEERDRTLSLQTGQPTIVGGVQVVPMTQGGPGPARYGSNRDPATSQPDYAQGYPAEQAQTPPATTAPSASGTYYQAQQSGQNEPAAYHRGGGSEGGYSEEEYETPATTGPPSGSHDPAAGGDGQWTGTYSNPQDYSGEGYAAPGWESVPRHHHPTRLSDVIEEEDERSRTASQVSRGGR